MNFGLYCILSILFMFLILVLFTLLLDIDWKKCINKIKNIPYIENNDIEIELSY